MDIGMGPAIGAANRNHRMMILEYDNQGYMNTGAQLSYSTPFGHRTSTSEVGTGAAGQALPPQGHRADLRRLPPALRVHRQRGLSRGPDAQGRESAVVRQARGPGVRQDPVLLPAQLAHGGRRRPAGAAGGDRQLLLPALRGRARPHDAHLRPRRERTAAIRFRTGSS